jgi:hypothetical protein
MEHRDEALSTRDLSSYAEPQPATYTAQHPTAVTEPQVAEPQVAEPQVAEPQPAEPQAQPTAGRELDDGQDGSLLPAQSGADFRGRWEGIQTRFVDDPRRAVEDADGLVATVMQELANGFAQRARAPRGAVGPRGGHLHRGPPGRATALPLVLPPAALDLSTEHGCSSPETRERPEAWGRASSPRPSGKPTARARGA